MSHLGERLKQLRGDETLHEVGKALGVNSSVISKYEKGFRVPIPAKMQELANYFDISVSELQKLALQDKLEKDLVEIAAFPELVNWLKSKVSQL